MAKAKQKVCATCIENKDVGEFGIRNSASDGRNTICKECIRDYQKARNDKLKEKKKNKEKEKNNARRKGTVAILDAMKKNEKAKVSEKKCGDCYKVLNIENFMTSDKTSDGYTSRCETCTEKRNKAYVPKNALTIGDIKKFIDDNKLSDDMKLKVINPDQTISYATGAFFGNGIGTSAVDDYLSLNVNK